MIPAFILVTLEKKNKLFRLEQKKTALRNSTSHH